jgi:membrane protein YqaA with SNARE-associated domain
LLALLDAVVPIVPSETAVITAGVVAAAGDLSLAMIVAAAAAGAFLDDKTAYWIGRRFGTRVVDRFFSSEKSRRRIAWAEGQLTGRGGELIAIARFIPGGRTAVTLSAGMLQFPWRRFIFFDAAAAVGLALYASLLGYRNTIPCAHPEASETSAVKWLNMLQRRKRGSRNTSSRLPTAHEGAHEQAADDARVERDRDADDRRLAVS